VVYPAHKIIGLLQDIETALTKKIIKLGEFFSFFAGDLNMKGELSSPPEVKVKLSGVRRPITTKTATTRKS